MVYIHVPDSKTPLGFSDFIPANSAADWTTQEDWGGGAGGAGVCRGGGRHFKVKGCGGNACPPTPILACVLLTIACFQDCTQQYLSDFKCKLSVNSVRNSLEANSKFSCKCISKFIRGHPTGPPPPRVPTAEG